MNVTPEQLSDMIDADAKGFLWIGSTAQGRAICADGLPKLKDVLALALEALLSRRSA